MVKLRDYLGSLISSINQARVLADVSSAKIALEYAEDEILKNFPIPRFRVQDIELTIPVALENLEEGIVRDYQPINRPTFNTKVYTLFKNLAKVKSFDRDLSQFAISQISSLVAELEKDLQTGKDKVGSFDNFKEKINELFIQLIIKAGLLDGLLKTYKFQNRDDLSKHLFGKMDLILFPLIKSRIQQREMGEANVLVEVVKLREVLPSNLIQIKMKLVEEGMEWHIEEDAAGDRKSKLLPE